MRAKVRFRQPPDITHQSTSAAKSYELTSAARHLFDEHICTKHQTGRQFEADRPGCFHVYYKIEPGRLFDRHLCRFGAAQDSADLSSDYVPIDLNNARPVTQETIHFGHFRPLIYCWHLKRRDVLKDDLSIVEEER
jgi:hypothetical protein